MWVNSEILYVSTLCTWFLFVQSFIFYKLYFCKGKIIHTCNIHLYRMVYIFVYIWTKSVYMFGVYINKNTYKCTHGHRSWIIKICYVVISNVCLSLSSNLKFFYTKNLISSFLRYLTSCCSNFFLLYSSPTADWEFCFDLSSNSAI